MTDKTIIRDKLANMREHAGRARTRRPDDRGGFEANAELQDAVALSVLVAVQEACDIAMHITADEGWGLPGSFGEAFELLSRNDVIAVAHSRELAELAALRGRIAHGYAVKFPGRLWTEVPPCLDALDRYGEAIAKLLTQ